MLTITFANLKPGTGKTTGAVWLAHALAETGRGVLLVDADPAASAAQWSDLTGGFDGIRVARIDSKDLDYRIASFARQDDVVIIDSPQVEDHAAIAHAAIRAADEIVVPVAPTPIEIARSAPVRDEIAKATAGTRTRPRISVLLNRCITGANSTGDAREALTGLGYDVLGYTVPRLEMYAQSFGGPVPGNDPIFGLIARELLSRVHMEVTR
jgi:chromosome partitioning protein